MVSSIILIEPAYLTQHRFQSNQYLITTPETTPATGLLNTNYIINIACDTVYEPGYYVEGSHGIRIENELLCLKDFVNEYGQFMKFESLTICPYDLDAVLVEELTKSEKDWLNAYHKECYEKLSPYLNEYENADSKSKQICGKLIAIEEELCKELKNYL